MGVSRDWEPLKKSFRDTGGFVGVIRRNYRGPSRDAQGFVFAALGGPKEHGY